MRIQPIAWSAAAALAVSLWITPPGAAQKQDQAEILLRGAAKKELVDGDIKAAIEQYQRIIASYAGDRAVVARALVGLGQCLEKQGHAEARAAYERVLREFADQAQPAAQARERLEALPAKDEVAGPKPRLRYLRALGSRLRETPNFLGLAPDGERMAYHLPEEGERKFGIWISDLAGFNARRITSGLVPAWSPDGARLVFSRPGEKPDTATLWVLSLPDGTERRLTEFPSVFAAWSPDGQSIAFLGFVGKPEDFRAESTGLYVMPAAGGEPQRLSTTGVPTWGGRMPLRWSPDSARVSFSRANGSRNSDLFCYDLKQRKETQLTTDRSANLAAGWSPDGKWAYFTSNRGGAFNLWKTPAPSESGGPAGTPRQVTEFEEDIQFVSQTPDCRKMLLVARNSLFRVGVSGAEGGQPVQMVKEGVAPEWLDDATLLMMAGRTYPWGHGMPGGHGDLFSVSQSGDSARRITDLGNVARSRLSPDRRLVAYVTLDPMPRRLLGNNIRLPGSVNRLFVKPVSGGQARLLLETQRSDSMAWSPDSKALAVVCEDRLVVVPAGGGPSRTLVTALKPDIGVQWSPDGSFIAYTTKDPGPFEDIYVVPAAGGKPRNLTNDPNSEHYAIFSISPDSRRIAHIKLEKPREEDSIEGLWITDVETGKGERVEDSAFDPVWSPDGNRIVFISWRGDYQDVWTYDVRTRKLQQITNNNDLEGDPQWSPDGKRIAFSLNRYDRQLWLFDNP